MANGGEPYRIEVTPAAMRDLRALAKTSRDTLVRVDATTQSLSVDPRPPGVKKLSGSSGYRVRVGEYRIIYAIDDQSRLVTIAWVRDRRDVYRP